MNYIFFDTECSNCLNGNGKICSFGYVKTDENFNVIKKKDILMNPEAPFLLGNAKTGRGISLAYPLFKFQNSHIFPRFYDEIRALLEKEDHIVFGFSVAQDINYLMYTCDRYHKKQINYKAFDIQQFERQAFNLKNTTSLDKLIAKYNLQVLTYHRSDDDAYMSMEVFIQLMKELNLSLEDTLKNYSSCYTSVDQVVEAKELRKKKQIENARLFKLYQSFIAKEDIQVPLSDINTHFLNKKFVISKKIFFEHSEELLKLKHKIIKSGAIIVDSFTKADIIIITAPSEYKLKEHQQFMLYKNFIKKINEL